MESTQEGRQHFFIALLAELRIKQIQPGNISQIVNSKEKSSFYNLSPCIHGDERVEFRQISHSTHHDLKTQRLVFHQNQQTTVHPPK